MHIHIETIGEFPAKWWRSLSGAVTRAVLVGLERIEPLRRKIYGRFVALPASARVTVIAVLAVLLSAFVFSAAVLALTFHYIYLDRSNMPDIEALVRFDCPTIGHLYDEQGIPLVELSTEHRRIIRYDEMPPVVRDAILAAEDKNFFSHGGIDYSSIPRVIEKIRLGALLGRVARIGRSDKAESPLIARQGGSTITQQLMRAYYLRELTEKENGAQAEPGALSFLVGSRNAKKLKRKLAEIRLSLWVEEELTSRFGSKQRAKEEILARYASFLYMGNNQYGFATAAEYYFGRPLTGFTMADADKAALLAGIAKSPRYYAPDCTDTQRILRRRNLILRLMEARGSLSREAVLAAENAPLQLTRPREDAAASRTTQVPAVMETALNELPIRYPGLKAEDALQGKVQIYSTADSRLQEIANEALEHGLAAYEKRHPKARGIIQGSVVILRNRDAAILAEVGGRRWYGKRSANYADFNRVTRSIRQPGSTMKPIVYLAAFLHGPFNLDSMAPDEPIVVPDRDHPEGKAISNYDGQFKGMIPLRVALAESRNAVAIWITEQIGISNVLRTARELGIQSQLQPWETTALGASEVTLLELANAYRTIATGVYNSPHLIRQVSRGASVVNAVYEDRGAQQFVNAEALALIQEGLRGVVRLPSGTAHSLDWPGLPVMGKTGTTSQYRDALFVGSTFGTEGMTIAVRIGFDDNRSLGAGETGGRAALPIFREIVTKSYAGERIREVPKFPAEIEESITRFLQSPADAPSESMGLSDGQPD